MYNIDMRERPVLSLLNLVLQHAEKSHAGRVAGLHIALGELSGVTNDSFRLQWAILAKDTIAEHATLYFRRVSAQLQCMACFQKYHPDGEAIQCPVCGSAGAKIIAGEEFSVEAIDLE